MRNQNGVEVGVRPLKVFCSYAHEDRSFLEQIRNHLGQLRQQKIIEWWDDRELLPGGSWDGVVRDQLKSADIIVFLVSANFINSEYCMEEEVRTALDRRKEGEAEVIPILVRSVDYEGSVFAQIQMLPPQARPIANWELPDDAYTAISREIRRLAQQWKWESKEPTGFWDVPQTAPDFVGREGAMQQVAGALAAGDPPVVALIGGGGIGKTSIAAKYARENKDRYDLVAWLRAEEESGLEWEFARLADRVGLASTNMHTAKSAFRSWLGDPDRWRDSRWLLVFDNATNVEAVQSLLSERMLGHAIVTSRESIWQDVAHEIDVGGLAEDDAVEYLLNRTGSTDEAGARRLAKAIGRVPLSLRQAVGTIREEQLTIDDYLRTLSGPVVA